jgi:hypothetical protein
MANERRASAASATHFNGKASPTMSNSQIDDVEDYFQPILRRIATLLGAEVIVDDEDDDEDEDWLQFHLPGLLAQQAIVVIEANNHQILIGDEQRMFQVLCAWNPMDDQSLWLHYLADAAARSEYRAGVWFY